MNNFNLNQAVKYVKAIADICRCVRCDELKGLRVRYPCGHSVCENCVLTAENCLLCLSLPSVSTHIIDDPLSLRVEHISNLLHSFQELFKLDVYRRQRISEQLQLEKQLFPECIQAVTKYSNNKRSSNISIDNKENIKCTLFPGENTSSSNIIRMENKIHYVQQWLNKNEASLRESKYNLPRKPFTDINVNGQNVTRPKTPNKVTKQKKPSRIKVPLKSFNSDFNNKSKLSLKRKKSKVGAKIDTENLNNKQFKCVKNESGIVIENEIVIIDETQSQVTDKDKDAWLAVIEADKNSGNANATVTKYSMNETDKGISTNLIDKQFQCQNVEAVKKVPFYKKSSLINYELNDCKNKTYIHRDTSKSNNVTISIDNSSFVTTIKLYEEQDHTIDRSKSSIGVQTDDGNNLKTYSDNYPKNYEFNLSSNKISNNNKENLITESDKSKNNKQSSADMFEEIAASEAFHTHKPVKESKGLIIDDSDSDSDILPTDKDSLIEVIAEVHQSETEIDCSVLSQLEQGEYEHRMRHAVRGHTPASTDSSDKENYDPNRAKRPKLGKKHCSKKH